MRKCKALPGARTELLSDLLIPKQDGQLCERTLCPHQTLLAEKWTPAAWAPAYAVLTAVTSKTQTSPSSLFPRCPAPAQAARSLRWPAPALLPPFGSLTRGWATLVLCLSSGRGPDAENSTLAEALVDPAQPCPGWEL